MRRLIPRMPRRRRAPQVATAPAPPPPPAGTEPEADAEAPARPSFRDRGRLRRRLRYLRRVRELGFRDLGGLIFDQHRFDRHDQALVNAKLTALAQVDHELRAIEHALRDERPIAELREAGVSLCAHCGGLVGSDARFCSTCGAPTRGARLHATAVHSPAATHEPAPVALAAPGDAGPVEDTQALHVRAEDAVAGDEEAAAPTTVERPDGEPHPEPHGDDAAATRP